MYKGYIYRHWLVNDESIEKSYIGQTSRDETKDRWNNGKGYLYVNGVGGEEADHKMARAIRKYGWDNFNHETLLTIECETEEKLSFWLDQWEQYFIEKYDSFYNGYNSTLGGGGCRGYKMSEEDRQKISDGRKGMKFTEEHKQHLSDSKKQKFASGEITVWNLGQEMSDEHKHKLSEAHKGKTLSEEHKQKLSEVFSGENHPMYGKHHTEESKQKMSSSKKGQCIGKNNGNASCVICLETLQVFETVKDASIWIGHKSHGNICSCCIGKKKSCGKHPETGEKLHWMYYDEYLEQKEVIH